MSNFSGDGLQAVAWPKAQSLGLAGGDLESEAGRKARSIRRASNNGAKAGRKVREDLEDSSFLVGEEKVYGEGDVFHPEREIAAFGIEKEHSSAWREAFSALKPSALLRKASGNFHAKPSFGLACGAVQNVKDSQFLGQANRHPGQDQSASQQ